MRLRELRVIDALLRPNVRDGSMWIRLPVPVLGTDRETLEHAFLTQTLGINAKRKTVHYCDGIYDPRVPEPSHLGSTATFTSERLFGKCKLVPAYKLPPV